MSKRTKPKVIFKRRSAYANGAPSISKLEQIADYIADTAEANDDVKVILGFAREVRRAAQWIRNRIEEA